MSSEVLIACKLEEQSAARLRQGRRMLSVFTNRVLLALALFAFIIFIGKTAMAIEE